MKKILMTILCAMFFTFGIALSANALTIDGAKLPEPPEWKLGTTYWEGNETSQNEIDGIIAAYIGTSQELYKSDHIEEGGGSGIETGLLAGSYSTTFSNEPNDPSNATITYTGGDVVGGDIFLLVKDGAATPAWYLFWLSNPITLWNGTDTIYLEDFWADGIGAISHVTLYGNGTQVPEPGMVILLGIGLIGLAFYSRRRLFN